MAGRNFYRHGAGAAAPGNKRSISNVTTTAHDGIQQLSNNSWLASGAFGLNLAIAGRAGATSGGTIFAAHFPRIVLSGPIKEATLELGINARAGTPNITLRGQAADDPAPAGASNLPSSWASTSATVTVPNNWTAGQRSLDVTAIVNEILSRPTFARRGLNLYITNNAGSDDHYYTVMLVPHGTFVRTQLTIRS